MSLQETCKSIQAKYLEIKELNNSDICGNFNEAVKLVEDINDLIDSISDFDYKEDLFNTIFKTIDFKGLTERFKAEFKTDKINDIQPIPIRRFPEININIIDITPLLAISIEGSKCPKNKLVKVLNEINGIVKEIDEYNKAFQEYKNEVLSIMSTNIEFLYNEHLRNARLVNKGITDIQPSLNIPWKPKQSEFISCGLKLMI